MCNSLMICSLSSPVTEDPSGIQNPPQKDHGIGRFLRQQLGCIDPIRKNPQPSSILERLGKVINRAAGIQKERIPIHYQFCGFAADRLLGGDIFLKMACKISALELDLLIKNCSPMHPNQPSFRLQGIQIIANRPLGNFQGYA